MSWLCSINLLSINIEQGMRQTSLCAAAVVGVSGSLFPSGCDARSQFRIRGGFNVISLEGHLACCECELKTSTTLLSESLLRLYRSSCLRGRVSLFSWFRSDFSASDAEEALTDKREGSFVARDSYGSPGDFALSIK